MQTTNERPPAWSASGNARAVGEDLIEQPTSFGQKSNTIDVCSGLRTLHAKPVATIATRWNQTAQVEAAVAQHLDRIGAVEGEIKINVERLGPTCILSPKFALDGPLVMLTGDVDKLAARLFPVDRSVLDAGGVGSVRCDDRITGLFCYSPQHRRVLLGQCCR